MGQSMDSLAIFEAFDTSDEIISNSRASIVWERGSCTGYAS
jgi:hypothetical protein